jgi:hypothetical protein
MFIHVEDFTIANLKQGVKKFYWRIPQHVLSDLRQVFVWNFFM